MLVMALVTARGLVVVVVVLLVVAIARVGTTLVVRVLCVLAMHVARLEALVLAWRRTLLVARVVGALLVLAALAVVASTTSVLASHAAQPFGPALLRKMAELAVVALA